MEHELQGKLVEILTSIQSGVGQAKDFALSQLPDIAQSYIVYGRVNATFTVCLTAALFFVSLWVALRFGLFSKKTDKYGLWANERIAAAIFGSGVALTTFVVLSESFSEFLLVWLAPKVWLLKELAHLVK